MTTHAIHSFKTTILVLIMGLAALSGYAQCEQHEAVMDNLRKAMETKNSDLLSQAYHEDAKRHLSGQTLEGIDAILEDARKFYASFPDALGTNVDMICSDDKVVSRWTGKGTHKESGKLINVTGITIYHIKDGKIVEEWEEMSFYSMMKQLGYEMKPAAGGGE